MYEIDMCARRFTWTTLFYSGPSTLLALILSVLTPNRFIDQDTWFLRITQPASDAVANAPPSVRWERRKAPMNRPNPPRAGVSMVYRKFLPKYYL